MIRRIRHKGLARFFVTGSLAGIKPAHAGRLRLVLSLLNTATRPQDLALPGLRLHKLSGDRLGRWAVSVSGNWRLTFEFSGVDADEVDYEDYH